MHNYEIIFIEIESMICSLRAIIFVFFWLILDRHSCLTLITLNKNSIGVLVEKHKDYKGSNYSKFKTGPRLCQD